MLSTTEDALERLFTDVVADRTSTDDVVVVERVKKIRDYAFVHFSDRELALAAMNRLHGQPASRLVKLDRAVRMALRTFPGQTLSRTDVSRTSYTK